MNVINKSTFVPAKYTSVWDGGIHVTTDCLVNMDTKEIKDIQIADVTGIDSLDYEYITVNGRKYPAGRIVSTEDDIFFYR